MKKQTNKSKKPKSRRGLHIILMILFIFIGLFVLGVLTDSNDSTTTQSSEITDKGLETNTIVKEESVESQKELIKEQERTHKEEKDEIEYSLGDTIKKGNYEVTLEEVSKNYVDLFESYNLCSDIFYSDCKSKGKESPYSKEEIEDIDRLRTEYVQHFSPDVLKEIYNKYGDRATKFLYIKHKHKVIDSSKLPDSAFEPFGLGYDQYTKESGGIYETSDLKIFDTKTGNMYNNLPQTIFNSNIGVYLMHITKDNSEYNPYYIPINDINNELKIIIIYSPCDIDFSEEERKITLQDIKDIEEGKKCDGVYIFTINPSELSNEVKLGY